MEYSIFTSVDYMLEAFESIDRIDVSLTRDNKIATIYLNNRYCDYDITIEDIKKLLNKGEVILLPLFKILLIGVYKYDRKFSITESIAVIWWF